MNESCFVVWQNTDLTEGKGRIRPIGYFEAEYDGLKFGAGKDVQGSNCRVTEEPLLQNPKGKNHLPLGPIYLHPASKEGIEAAKRDKVRDDALKRAVELGLTDEEIAAIQS